LRQHERLPSSRRNAGWIASGDSGIRRRSLLLDILAGLRERRKLLANELERLGELNHTVRNSLHLITLAVHTVDERHKTLVLESTARIDEKLRELFQAVGTKK
jgi:hypothetical protein